MKGISDKSLTRPCLCLHVYALLTDDSHIVPVIQEAIIEEIMEDILLATRLQPCGLDLLRSLTARR